MGSGTRVQSQIAMARSAAQARHLRGTQNNSLLPNSTRTHSGIREEGGFAGAAILMGSPWRYLARRLTPTRRAHRAIARAGPPGRYAAGGDQHRHDSGVVRWWIPAVTEIRRILDARPDLSLGLLMKP